MEASMDMTKLIGLIFFLIFAIGTCSAQGVGLEKKAIERGRQYEHSFLKLGAKHGVDERLLWVIAYLETRFNPLLISQKGARGLMQLMPATAMRYGAADPHNPIEAIDAAAAYLRHLLVRFDGRLDLVLAAYNAGEETVESYRLGRSIQAGGKIINPSRKITGGIPPYPETRQYVSAGLNILKGSGSTLNFAREKSFKEESRTTPRRSIAFITTIE
jgi:soluble lytic murein transglycosylase-like protein